MDATGSLYSLKGVGVRGRGGCRDAAGRCELFVANLRPGLPPALRVPLPHDRAQKRDQVFTDAPSSTPLDRAPFLRLEMLDFFICGPDWPAQASASGGWVSDCMDPHMPSSPHSGGRC